MKYPCIMCGLCCSFLDGVTELEHLNNGHGVCVHLKKNKKCEIYDSRPIYCSTKIMFDTVISSDMSEEEFMYANLSLCLSLNERFGTAENVSKLKTILSTFKKTD